MFTLNIDPSAQNLGLRIYSIGTGIQQAFICVFAALLIRFVFEVKRDASLERDWLSARRLVRMIAIVLSLISVSCLSVQERFTDMYTAAKLVSYYRILWWCILHRHPAYSDHGGLPVHL